MTFLVIDLTSVSEDTSALLPPLITQSNAKVVGEWSQLDRKPYLQEVLASLKPSMPPPQPAGDTPADWIDYYRALNKSYGENGFFDIPSGGWEVKAETQVRNRSKKVFLIINNRLFNTKEMRLPAVKFRRNAAAWRENGPIPPTVKATKDALMLALLYSEPTTFYDEPRDTQEDMAALGPQFVYELQTAMQEAFERSDYIDYSMALRLRIRKLEAMLGMGNAQP